MAKKKSAARKRVMKVMEQFELGKLRSGTGKIVRSRNAALAIALSGGRRTRLKRAKHK